MTPLKARGSRLMSRVIVLTTALSLLLVACKSASWPFSAIFPLLHSEEVLLGQARHLNRQRADTARGYFRDLPKRSPSWPPSPATPTDQTVYAIAIVTINRKKSAWNKDGSDVSYVLQSAAALDRHMRESEVLQRSVLFICNVDYDPQSHEDAAFLKNYFPYVERYGSSSIPLPDLRIPLDGRRYNETRYDDVIDKERVDYMFCLEAAASLGPDYVILVEDDAVPTEDFPSVLDHNIKKLEKKHECPRGSSQRVNTSRFNSPTFNSNSFRSLQSSVTVTDLSILSVTSAKDDDDAANIPENFTQREDGSSDVEVTNGSQCFAYFKLSFPLAWQSFNHGLTRLGDLFCMAVMGGGLSVLVHVLLSRPSPISSKTLWKTFTFGALVTLSLAIMIGRQNINQLRCVSKHLYRLQTPPGCCTQAMLFPSHVIPRLVTWLGNAPSGAPVDLAMPGFAEYNGLSHYYLEPNLFRHIGMISSLSKLHRRPIEEYLFS